jgi:dihydropyrimidinase
MAITKADEGALADMGAMVEEGVSTFKVFLAYKDVLMVRDDEFLAVLEQTRDTGGLVMVHAENGDAIDLLVKQALAAGNTEPRFHALTRPAELETEATGRAIRLAEYAGTPIFIVHVTQRAAAEEIGRARLRGVPAYGETCAQYLFFTEEDLARPDFEGARYVCSPPLRTRADQEYLWDALKYDVLQICSTDHCPFNDEQKRLGLGDFSKIPNGLAMIQHRLPLLWEHGVRAGRLSPNRLVEVLSTTVAKTFGLYPRKGTIAPGADADIVIFDPNRRFTFGTDTSFMNVDYDLFDGQSVAGSPRLTLSRGTTVFEDGRILTSPGHGRFTKRSVFDPALDGNRPLAEPARL